MHAGFVLTKAAAGLDPSRHPAKTTSGLTVLARQIDDGLAVVAVRVVLFQLTLRTYRFLRRGAVIA